jgi:hypothetical protein
MTMDAGYGSEDDANACADQGMDAYIKTPMARTKHHLVAY